MNYQNYYLIFAIVELTFNIILIILDNLSQTDLQTVVKLIMELTITTERPIFHDIFGGNALNYHIY